MPLVTFLFHTFDYLDFVIFFAIRPQSKFPLLLLEWSRSFWFLMEGKSREELRSLSFEKEVFHIVFLLFKMINTIIKMVLWSSLFLTVHLSVFSRCSQSCRHSKGWGPGRCSPPTTFCCTSSTSSSHLSCGPHSYYYAPCATCASTCYGHQTRLVVMRQTVSVIWELFCLTSVLLTSSSHD